MIFVSFWMCSRWAVWLGKPLTDITRKIALFNYLLTPWTPWLISSSSLPFKKFFPFCTPWPEGRRDRGMDLLNVMKTDCGCVKVRWHYCLDSTSLSQACLPSAVTFCRPCLRGTFRTKCHSKIYSCEHWLVERGEGVCIQVGRVAENKWILAVIGFSIVSFSFLKFHLLLFPFLSTVISSVLWNAPPVLQFLLFLQQ